MTAELGGPPASDYRAADFEYELPAELIAQEPVAERGASRLLVVEREDGHSNDGAGRAGASHESVAEPSVGRPSRPSIQDRDFRDLSDLIAAGDLVVLNTTRVRHARLLGMRPSGGPAEVLLIHPDADGTWVAIGKPGGALRPGRRITLAPNVAVETVKILADGNRIVRFVGMTADEVIRRFGRLPLPPYIRRDPVALDETRYQTVYAEREGSVAAPTAGLHFTREVLAALERRGVAVARLSLEVGPGTFKPVDEDEIARHPMHPERYDIPEAAVRAVDATRARRGAVWAVGTTVVRALETAADARGRIRAGAGETRLMIAPGYNFQVVDRLLTNFHLPRSTLLMLVAAFAGYETTMTAYRHAVEQRYRFYSYGDAMAIL